MRAIFSKRKDDLTEKQRWYLERYLSLSPALREAYELKEAYVAWFDQAKELGMTGCGSGFYFITNSKITHSG